MTILLLRPDVSAWQCTNAGSLHLLGCSISSWQLPYIHIHPCPVCRLCTMFLHLTLQIPPLFRNFSICTIISSKSKSGWFHWQQNEEIIFHWEDKINNEGNRKLIFKIEKKSNIYICWVQHWWYFHYHPVNINLSIMLYVLLQIIWIWQLVLDRYMFVGQHTTISSKPVFV